MENVLYGIALTYQPTRNAKLQEGLTPVISININQLYQDGIFTKNQFDGTGETVTYWSIKTK